MSKAVKKVWRFPSSSSDKTYETLQYDDDTTSCNCPGWTRRVAVDGSRSCRHTRLVDQGCADMECLTSHDYADGFVAEKPKIQTPPVKPARAKPAVVKPAARKIRWQ
jgi:hypothetical protein